MTGTGPFTMFTYARQSTVVRPRIMAPTIKSGRLLGTRVRFLVGSTLLFLQRADQPSLRNDLSISELLEPKAPLLRSPCIRPPLSQCLISNKRLIHLTSSDDQKSLGLCERG